MFILEEISCGGNLITMDRIIPDMTSLVVTLIKIGIPVLLIIFGMLDLGKAVFQKNFISCISILCSCYCTIGI